MTYRFEITSALTMSLRADHNTAAAKISSLEIGKIAKGDEIWESLDAVANVRSVGDKWLHVKELNGAVVDGWMAIIHLGRVYCDLVDTGVVDPPLPLPDEGVKKIMYGTVTYETNSGNIVTKELFPQ